MNRDRKKERKFLWINISSTLFFIFMGGAILFRIEPYSFTNHFLSDAGLLRIDGQYNLISFFLFSMGLISYAFLSYTMGSIFMGIQTIRTPIKKRIAYCFYLSSLSAIVTMLFPKDVALMAHFYASMGVFLGFLMAISLILINTENLHLLSISGGDHETKIEGDITTNEKKIKKGTSMRFSSVTLFFLIFAWVSFLLFNLSKVIDYYEGFFQKIFIFETVLTYPVLGKDLKKIEEE